MWPEHLPLTSKLGVIDFHADEQPLEESIELVRRFKSLGLDLLDVSLGFNAPDVSRVSWGPGFMVPLSERIRREAEIPVAVGWLINEPEHADNVISSGQADLVFLARAMLSDPHWPFHAAAALGAEQPYEMLPPQRAHWLKRR